LQLDVGLAGSAAVGSGAAGGVTAGGVTAVAGTSGTDAAWSRLLRASALLHPAAAATRTSERHVILRDTIG
jgi:hypothetical protein